MICRVFILTFLFFLANECTSQTAFLERNQSGVLFSFNKATTDNSRGTGGSIGVATAGQIEIGFSYLSSTISEKQSTLRASTFAPSIGVYPALQDSAYPLFFSFHISVSATEFEVQKGKGDADPSDLVILLGAFTMAHTFSISESSSAQPSISAGVFGNIDGLADAVRFSVQLSNTFFTKIGAHFLFLGFGWAWTGEAESIGINAGLVLRTD